MKDFLLELKKKNPNYYDFGSLMYKLLSDEEFLEFIDTLDWDYALNSWYKDNVKKLKNKYES